LTVDDKPKCLQRNLYNWKSEVEGDEDCLYLNVYRPLGLDHTLPVLLYFPHSDFMYGTGARSEIAPDIIMNANSMIVVVAQFRVGLMGFFSTGDDNAPGNMGLKDQAKAIDWVLDQAPSFNGNIDKFTVYGDASVIYHMIRPDFFFDRAIISGSYPMSYFRNGGAFTQDEASATAKRLASALGYGDIPTTELVEKMRKEKLHVLMDRMVDLMGDFHFPFHLFGPTIEPESRTAFLTESPEELWKNWEGDIPIMIGFSPFYGDQMIRGLENVPFYSKRIKTDEAVRRLVQLEPYAEHRIFDILRYYNLKKLYEFHITKDYRHNYVDMMNDRYYAQPLQQLIFWYNKNTHQKDKKMYLYRVMFDAPYNDGEVPYLFHNYDNDQIYNFEYNEEFLTLMRDFIEAG
jgi:carboxylesterase type B